MYMNMLSSSTVLLAAAVCATPLVPRQSNAETTTTTTTTIVTTTTASQIDNSTITSTSTSSFLTSITPFPLTNGTNITTTTSSSSYSRPSMLGNPAANPNPPGNASLVAALLTADSTVSRFRRLKEAIGNGTAAAKFDYNPAANPGQVPGQGGEVVVANRAAFPMVTTLGIAGAVFFFAPCGLNSPHTHPRGSEIFTVASKSTINVGFVLENGLVQEINTTLSQYQGTVFPVGSTHWQQNMGCKPAVAIGALNSEDPGTSSTAQNFLVNTNSDIVEATLGYPQQITAENFASLKASIAPSFVKGVKECYQRCGLQY